MYNERTLVFISQGYIIVKNKWKYFSTHFTIVLAKMFLKAHKISYFYKVLGLEKDLCPRAGQTRGSSGQILEEAPTPKL